METSSLLPPFLPAGPSLSLSPIPPRPCTFSLFAVFHRPRSTSSSRFSFYSYVRSHPVPPFLSSSPNPPVFLVQPVVRALYFHSVCRTYNCTALFYPDSESASRFLKWEWLRSRDSRHLYSDASITGESFPASLDIITFAPTPRELELREVRKNRIKYSQRRR